MFRYKLKDCQQNEGISRRSINGIVLFNRRWVEFHKRRPELEILPEIIEWEDTDEVQKEEYFGIENDSENMNFREEDVNEIIKETENMDVEKYDHLSKITNMEYDSEAISINISDENKEKIVKIQDKLNEILKDKEDVPKEEISETVEKSEEYDPDCYIPAEFEEKIWNDPGNDVFINKNLEVFDIESIKILTD